MNLPYVHGNSGANGSGNANNHVLRQPSWPRGRPNVSKNKALRSRKVAIKIPAGKDVGQWLFQFCCHFKASLAVVSGSGWLSNAVMLHRRQLVPTVGPFQIRSLSGTVTMNPRKNFSPFQVVLVRRDGQLLCNQVMVKGTAIATVNVTATMTWFETVENTRSSLNVQLGESYNSVTTPPVNNLMNSSAGIERVAMTVAETTLMNDKAWSELSNEAEAEIDEAVHNQKDDEEYDVMMTVKKNDELGGDFWNSLNPIVDLSTFERV